MKIFFALALVIYFPCFGSGANLTYQSYPSSQCYTDKSAYAGDRADNPIFNGGGFVGIMTAEECKNMCDDETMVDEHDRRCVAYEHSSQDPTDVANCGLAWACETTRAWGTGATYTTEFDCERLPVSMNGYGEEMTYEYGCPGAVWQSGEGAQRYCEGKDIDDNEVFPWWKECCTWDAQTEKCIAK